MYLLELVQANKYPKNIANMVVEIAKEHTGVAMAHMLLT